VSGTGKGSSRPTRTANLLGALSLVIVDRTSDAIAETADQSDTAAAALSALHHFLEHPTIDMLRQVLGLTPSGTVRLVDRLQDAGHVRRGAGSDGRSTLVALTASGRRAAERVSGARASVLEGALSGLTVDERKALDDIASRLLVEMMRGPGATRWICRMCDVHACRQEAGGCPIHNAAKEKYGLGY
jgi:DNA-binding MarR family transcriptional regulator